MAVNCWVLPATMLGELGVTAMEEIVGAVAVTARLAVPLIPVCVAVIVEEPAETPVARPAAVMVATEVVPELHVTLLVMLPVVPSL